MLDLNSQIITTSPFAKLERSDFSLESKYIQQKIYYVASGDPYRSACFNSKPWRSQEVLRHYWGMPETNEVRGRAGRGETPKKGWYFSVFFVKKASYPHIHAFL